MIASLRSGNPTRSAEIQAEDRLSLLETLFAEHENKIQSCIPEPDRFNRLHKDLNSLISRHPDPNNRPPLFGLLFGVKDIFHAHGFVTRAGSRLPPEELTGDEAASVHHLLEAGALNLGKTVTTEFAYFAPGPTRNPHNLEHTPGGSSSGSAAAVAAGFCDLALGTQTIGSIIRPASFCGVVGFKPTFGRISTAGVIPLSPSLDHVGVFSTDVDTAQRAAIVLIEDWKINALKGRPALGIPAGSYLDQVHPEARAHFENLVKKLTNAGYDLHSIDIFSDFELMRARHDLILSAQAAQVHEKWFEKYQVLYSTRTAQLIERGRNVPQERLQQALQECKNLRAYVLDQMNQNGFDLWIAPSAPGVAPRGLHSTGDPVMNLPWTQVGLPAINLPAGRNEAGLPFGLQVIGKWNADEQLLDWALELESLVSRP